MTDREAGVPPRLGELLEPVTTRLGVGNAAAAGRLWSRWTEVVGEKVARHAEPTSLRSGTLRIRAESPAWAMELGYLANEIKERANFVAERPVVHEVRVWTGAPPSRRDRSSRRAARAESQNVPTGRVPANDPATALQRARAAWRKWVRSGSERSSNSGVNH